MRLFIAIPIPHGIRQHLVELRARLAPPVVPTERVKWVKPANMHLTMKFLGDCPAEKIEGLMAALRACLADVEPVRTSGISYFPRTGSINVLVAPVVGGIGPILDMAHRLHRACASIGFPAERRPFKPHVTVGRAKGTLTARDLWEAHGIDDAPSEYFFPETLGLYESRLGGPDPVYSEVDSVALRPANS